MTVKNDDGIVEVNSSGESSYACKTAGYRPLGPATRKTVIAGQGHCHIRLARSTRPASSTSAFLRAAKLE